MLWRNVFLLLTLALLWGPSFLFIKVAVKEIGPFTIAMARVLLAGMLLLILLLMQKERLPGRGRVWFDLLIMSVLTHVFPFVAIGFGELYIDSAVAAILNGTTPIFTLVLAHFSGERINTSKLLGVLLGFGGIIVLVLPDMLGGMKASLAGIGAVMAAAISYGCAIIFSRRRLLGLPRLVAPTYQLLFAAVFLVPLGFIFESPTEALFEASKGALYSVLALSLFGTALAFVIYYRLAETAESTFISLVTFLMPIVGVILGVMVLKENLSIYTYAGFGLILAAIGLVREKKSA